jgi:spore coat polysaccharide biosynthesis predicted glycosyltransferase SpsG
VTALSDSSRATLLLLLADAFPAAGLGHVSRATAVADAARETGLAPRCLALGAREPLERDGIRWEPVRGLEDAGDPAVFAAIVLDSYELPPPVVAAWAPGVPLVVMHDLGGVPPEAALVVAPAREEAGEERLLTGLAYACLRRAYWSPPPRAYPEEVGTVLVTTGGGDPGGRAAALASAAMAAFPGATVRVVRGPYASGTLPPGTDVVEGRAGLADELARADVVLTAAGQTMLEALATAAPTVAVPLADNQRRGAEALARAGGVLLAEPDEAQMRAALGELAGVRRRRELGGRGRELVDGRGALRVAERIAALIAG